MYTIKARYRNKCVVQYDDEHPGGMILPRSWAEDEELDSEECDLFSEDLDASLIRNRGIVDNCVDCQSGVGWHATHRVI